MLLFLKLVEEIKMSKPPDATRHSNSTKLLIPLPFSANSKSTFQYETHCKGQLISKGHFGFFNAPKNQQKISALVGKNLRFQVHFLGELETPKRHFEIN